MIEASLHVVTSDARRGAETFAVDLTATLEAAGRRAWVVALTASGMAEVHDVPTLGSARRAAGTLKRLRTAARHADVVVAHGSSTLEACALGLAGAGTPFVYRTIGDPSYWVTSAWRRRGIGWMLRRAARNVVLWPAAGEQLAAMYAIPPERVDVIPNAVAAARFDPADGLDRRQARKGFGVPDDRPCLAFVGSLSPEKDVASLLMALGHLEDVSLVVAGDGPEGSRLRALADDLAPGRVRFLGASRDPRAVYAAADALVLPSLSEGLPAVIVEAGLMEIPTIASAVGAIAEVIDDTVTGYLVPPGEPELLAKRIEEALPHAGEVGRRARDAFLGRFTMEAVLPAWEATLEAAVR